MFSIVSDNPDKIVYRRGTPRRINHAMKNISEPKGCPYRSEHIHYMI